MQAIIINIEDLVYDEDVNQLYVGEVVEVLTIDYSNEFVLVLSKSGEEHGIDLERIEILN
jgi:hypothetical protein